MVDNAIFADCLLRDASFNADQSMSISLAEIFFF